ncbi:hypothetical protein PI125_g23489 [Phytophthora idaei]|nr:hypothetical protein PI125_g23489 [Phytophthora idaei]
MIKGVKDYKTFKFLHCWRVLSNEPKCRAFRQQAVSGTDAVSTTVKRTSDFENQRPRENKAAKAAAKLVEKSEQNNKRMSYATARMAAASGKRVRVMEEKNNLIIMSLSLTRNS